MRTRDLRGDLRLHQHRARRSTSATRCRVSGTRAGVPPGRRGHDEPDHDRARQSERRRHGALERQRVARADGRRRRRSRAADRVIEDDAAATSRRAGVVRSRPGRHRLLREPRGMRVQMNDAVRPSGRATASARSRAGDTGRRGRAHGARRHRDPRRTTSTPSGHPRRRDPADAPRRTSATRFTRPMSASSTTASATSSCSSSTSSPPSTAGSRRETTGRRGRDELAVATFNVENLDPGDAPADKFAALARADRQQPALAGPHRDRGDPGQQRPDRTTRRRCVRHAGPS